MIKNIILKLKNNPFWKSVATLSAGQIIAQLINIVSIPIISRIYSKTAYGDFGIVTSTATIIVGFIGMGLSSAIMVPKTKEESKTIFKVTYFLQFILSLLICAVIIIISFKIKLFETQIPYFLAIIIMFLYICLSSLSSLMNIYVNKLNMNKVLFFNPLIGAMSTLLITLPLGLLGLDIIGLYIANIVTLIIVNAHMLTRANPFKGKFNFADIKNVFIKYKHFVIYQYPANLMDTFTLQAPNQILSNNFGNAALGDYAMCNKIFSMPMSLISAPIQTVYFRTASQKYRDGEDIADFTYSLVMKIMLLAIIPIITLMSFGETLFSFILGSQWKVAGTLASILALQYVFSFCYNCITYCRVCINKQKINLYTSIAQVVTIVSSLLIGALFFKSLIGTISCFAVANLIFSIINIAINFYCLKKYTFKFVTRAILFCFICVAVTFILKWLLKI